MIAAGIEFAEAGEGPVVVCLHGIGGGIESFAPQMAGIAPPSASPRLGALPPNPRDISEPEKELEGYRVISVNLPGYGASEAAVWPPSFESLSEALAVFIDALGVGPVHLVGQSIGGMLALEHTLRRPDQVASLVLIGTTPSFGGRDDSFKEAFLKARLAPLEAGQSMAEMAAEAAPQVVASGTSAAVIDAVAAPMAAVSQVTWRGILECLVTFNRRDDLGQVAQPCCLIAGGQDQNAPARTMAKMADKLPDAEYHLIEAAGHMIHQEAPAQTNHIIMDFLGRQGA